jgi:hypothetical protein
MQLGSKQLSRRVSGSNEVSSAQDDASAISRRLDGPERRVVDAERSHINVLPAVETGVVGGVAVLLYWLLCKRTADQSSVA